MGASIADTRYFSTVDPDNRRTAKYAVWGCRHASAEAFIPHGKPRHRSPLHHYVFVYGPVSKAFVKCLHAETGMLLLFEKGKAARTEINLGGEMLKFRAQNGVNSPC